MKCNFSGYILYLWLFIKCCITCHIFYISHRHLFLTKNGLSSGYDNKRGPLTSMDKLLTGPRDQQREHQVDSDRHHVHHQTSHLYFCFLF